MARKIKRGQISKDIESLCIGFCLKGGSEVEFKKGIEKLLKANNFLGNLLFYDIALAFRKSAVDCKVTDMEKMWKLTDQVDERIRAAWNKYEKTF